MPQPRLHDTRLLGDSANGRFMLIGFAGMLDGIVPSRNGFVSTYVAEEHEELTVLLNKLRVAALLIRPDFYCLCGFLETDKFRLKHLKDIQVDQFWSRIN